MNTPGGKLYRTAVKMLATVGLLFLLVTFTPFVSWYATKLARPWEPYEGDTLIVLSAARPNTGGSAAAPNVMDISTYWRCFMAVLYYREQPYKEVVVSGKDSARGMRDFLVFSGIPADRILVENEASDTHQNAQFTARLLAGHPGSVVLVTSDFHMFRARRAFLKAGLRVSASAVPDVTKRSADYFARPQLFLAEMRETAAIVYYRYQGWI